MFVNNNSLLFWKKVSNELVTWQKKPTKIFKINNGFKWFYDGRLNVYENCILKNNENKIALTCVDKNLKFEKWVDLPFLQRQEILNKRVLDHLPQYNKYELIISYLVNLIKKFKEINKNLSFCIVVPPYSNEYLEAFSKVTDIDKFNEYINLISIDNNFKYFNFSRLFYDKQDLFADQEHLNNNGRDIFSKKIKKSC